MQSKDSPIELTFRHAGKEKPGCRAVRRSGGRLGQMLKFIGPAFIVSVAYIDPGNFATNIEGGSVYNYTLIWVILWSNVLAIFLQTMSAKLGIATGHNLPEMCAKAYSKRVNRVFWVLAEVGAMATDLAEFLGGTLGLNILFGMPMFYAGLLTGLLTFFICCLERYGQKLVEIVIAGFVAVVGAAYLLELFLARPDWAQVGWHTVVPSLPDGHALILAAGMLGATVMPHVIYLHSQLVRHRCGNGSAEEKRHHFKMEKIDIAIAMNIAFCVNAAMVAVSAAVFFRHGMVVDTMQQAQQSLTPLLGPLSGGAFGIALLASGLSSSAVGTMAGQTVMQGFVNLSIPVNLRRLITMLPALVIIAAGVNPMQALVWSQVALSFILPLPVLQMLSIAGKRKWMGEMVNRPWEQALGIAAAAVIIAMNALLLVLTFTGQA